MNGVWVTLLFKPLFDKATIVSGTNPESQSIKLVSTYVLRLDFKRTGFKKVVWHNNLDITTFCMFQTESERIVQS